MATLTAKRGDTITFSGTRTDSNGAAVSLADTTVNCEMVLGELRQAFTAVVVSAAAGTFRLVIEADVTENLRTGLWSADVQFTSVSGNVISTDTFYVHVLEDVTNAAS